MNPSSDDAQIRRLVQRLKRRDQEGAPCFDEVLDRSPRGSTRSRARPIRWVVACGGLATLLATVVMVRSHVQSIVDRQPRVAEDNGRPRPVDIAQDERIAKIDFERAHRAVKEHFRETAIPAGSRVPVWSSATESLLALHVGEGPIQE